MEREYMKKEFVRKIFDCYGTIVDHLGLRRCARWMRQIGPIIWITQGHVKQDDGGR